jgi:hypothetical protein
MVTCGNRGAGRTVDDVFLGRADGGVCRMGDDRCLVSLRLSGVFRIAEDVFGVALSPFRIMSALQMA